jgi:hypothetical protein
VPRSLRPSAHRVLLPSIAAVQLAIACLSCARDRPGDPERSLVTITADPQAKTQVASSASPVRSEATPSPPGMAIHDELAAPGPPEVTLVQLGPAPPLPVALPPPAYHPPAVMGTVSMPVTVPALPPATSATPSAVPALPTAPPATPPAP